MDISNGYTCGISLPSLLFLHCGLVRLLLLVSGEEVAEEERADDKSHQEHLK